MGSVVKGVCFLVVVSASAFGQDHLKAAAVPGDPNDQQMAAPLVGQVAGSSILNDKTLKVVIGRVHSPENGGSPKGPSSEDSPHALGKPYHIIAAQVKRTASDGKSINPAGNGSSPADTYLLSSTADRASPLSAGSNQFAASSPENNFSQIAQLPISSFSRPDVRPAGAGRIGPSEYDRVCCDVKIVELYEKLYSGGWQPFPHASSDARSFSTRQAADPSDCSASNPYCCDPRIVKIMEEVVELKKASLRSSPLGGSRATRFHAHHVPSSKEREAASSVFRDPSTAPTVIFSTVGLAQEEQKSDERFQVVKFKKTRHNFGEGFDAATSVFRAPESGLYSFQLRLHSGDTSDKNKTCIAIAAYPGLETRTAEACIESDTTGFIIANRVLREGEQVVAVFAGHVVSTSASSSKIPAADPDDLRFAEFFGLLVRPVVAGV